MGMFQEGRCVSVSNAVMVFADPSGPAPLPDRFRELLEAWLLGAGEARDAVWPAGRPMAATGVDFSPVEED